MSYDLEMFQLRDGVTVEQINAFLDSVDYERYQEECEEADERGEELPSIPARFINAALTDGDLRLIAGKAYLRVTLPGEHLPDDLRHFLESDKATEAPAPWQETIEEMFEFCGGHGMFPIVFSYGGDLKRATETVARMLEDLKPRRMAVYDPQLDRVVDGSNARQLLMESAAGAQANFSAFINSIVQDDGNVRLFDDEDEDEKKADK